MLKRRKVCSGQDFEAELVVLLVELVRDVGGDVPFVEEQPVGIDAPVDGVLLHLGQVLLLLLGQLPGQTDCLVMENKNIFSNLTLLEEYYLKKIVLLLFTFNNKLKI